jgi:hypothetical protein
VCLCVAWRLVAAFKRQKKALEAAIEAQVALVEAAERERQLLRERLQAVSQVRHYHPLLTPWGGPSGASCSGVDGWRPRATRGG